MPEPTYSQIEAACVAMWGDTHPDFFERDLMKAALIAAQNVDRNVYGELHYGWGTDGVFYQCSSVEAQRRLARAFHAIDNEPHLRERITALTSMVQDRDATIQANEGILATEVKAHAKVRRDLTDLRYMMAAIVPMLGEKARKVWKAWQDKNVVRLHFDWATDPMALAGEDVAQVHLDWIDAEKDARPLSKAELEQL